MIVAPAAWHRFGERGSVAGMRFIVWLYRLVGRRVCGVFILPVVAYFFLTGRHARRASRTYLARLHEWSGGHLPRRRRPSCWDAFLQHREFGLNILDRVAFWQGDSAGFELVVHGEDALARLLDRRQGAVLVSAHLGSFDALRLYAARGKVVVNVVMYLAHARMINAIFRDLNPTVDLRMITPDPGSADWLFDLRARIAAGEMVGLLADRIGPHERRHISVVPFLGVPAPFPLGPFLLARRLGCPLFLLVGLRRDWRRYDIFIERLDGAAESAELLLRAYVSRLEVYCSRAPYQWFNFYDFWAGGAPAPRVAGLESVPAMATGRPARV